MFRAVAAEQTSRGRRAPNSSDPSLYEVRVKPGKEIDVIMRLTNKQIYHEERGSLKGNNHIISAFYRGTKGRICIEATRSDYAKEVGVFFFKYIFYAVLKKKIHRVK